jgi:hypothetical protein
MDVLYLDYDGPLHPDDVWYEPASRQPSLRTPGHELFENVPVVEAAIAQYPALKIVLSTSWVVTFGLEKTCDFLPQTLRRRVIGATYDPQAPDAWRFTKLRRYDAIALDVRSRLASRWLAIDDDALGWPAKELDALVLVPTGLGLMCPVAQALLRDRLAARFPITDALAPPFAGGPDEVK